ncbi:MAG: Fe-S cluster assembly protein SufD, partial [Reinekea sp.]
MTVALNTLNARSAVAQAAAPQWLKDWQQQGQDDFAALAWPTRKTEAWKYTPLKALLDVTWQKSTESTDEPGVRFEHWNEIRIDLVNGQIQDIPTLPAGVSLRRLSDCSAEEGLAFLARIDAERNGFVFDS